METYGGGTDIKQKINYTNNILANKNKDGTTKKKQEKHRKNKKAKKDKRKQTRQK